MIAITTSSSTSVNARCRRTLGDVNIPHQSLSRPGIRDYIRATFEIGPTGRCQVRERRLTSDAQHHRNQQSTYIPGSGTALTAALPLPLVLPKRFFQYV